MKQFEEKGAQLISLSADPRASLRAWAQSLGGMSHPLVTDFWPHGETLRAYGVFNDESGSARRSLTIIDPQGVVRHQELHQGTLPDVAETLANLDNLQAG